jgi:hypothetical protein
MSPDPAAFRVLPGVLQTDISMPFQTDDQEKIKGKPP